MVHGRSERMGIGRVAHIVDKGQVAIGERHGAADALHCLVHEARHVARGGAADEVRHVGGVGGAVVAVAPPVWVRVQRVVHAERCERGTGGVDRQGSGQTVRARHSMGEK